MNSHTDRIASLAEVKKQAGNELFGKNKVNAAVEAYTEAISLCPTVPVYWTNRALCYRKLESWSKVQQDTKKALELDPHSIKAHYLLGVALAKMDLVDEAILHLEKAMDLARTNYGAASANMMEDIWKELAIAEYAKWKEEASLRKAKREQLRSYLEGLLAADRNRILNEASGQSTERRLEDDFVDRLNSLENVFDAAAERDRVTEVPDYLCCKITMDVFRDPVITPYGISYERAAITEHLLKKGHEFDPVTRQPLKASQLVPNLALREAVQEYLAVHGWAYKP